MKKRVLLPLFVCTISFAREVPEITIQQPVKDAAKVFRISAPPSDDDGPLIRETLAKALAAGPGASVVFEKRVYRLKECAESLSQMVVSHASDLVIDGQGATLELEPPNTFVTITDSRCVQVKNFIFKYDRPYHTQGTIINLDRGTGYFDLKIHAGYAYSPGYPAAKLPEKLQKWGTVMDSIKRRRKWSSNDHLMIEKNELLPNGIVRFFPASDYKKELEEIERGDRFAINGRFPWHTAQPKGRGTDSNIALNNSSDCLLENLTTYGGPFMNVEVGGSVGPNIIRQLRDVFMPDTDALISTWKDGMHCKANRGPLLIENCEFEGLLDDSINISTMAAFCTEAISETEFLLDGAFLKGDRIAVLDLAKGYYVLETTVMAAEDAGRQTRVTLADPLTAKVKLGKLLGDGSTADLSSTQFYNLSACGAGSVIRNNRFGAQRRHALLLRAPHASFVSNTAEYLGGCAVYGGNEIGRFNEGPLPTDLYIADNKITETLRPAFHVESLPRKSIPEGKQALTGVIIKNNEILFDRAPAVCVERAQKVWIGNNKIMAKKGAVNAPILVRNSFLVTDKKNTMNRKRVQADIAEY